MVQEKEQFKNNLFFRLLAVVLIGVTGFLGVSAGRAVLRRQQIEREIADLEKEISAAEQKNKEISARLEYYKSKENLEKEARLQFNLKRPGENVVVIVRDGAVGSSSDAVGGSRRIPAPDPKISNPGKWINYFFK